MVRLSRHGFIQIYTGARWRDVPAGLLAGIIGVVGLAGYTAVIYSPAGSPAWLIPAALAVATLALIAWLAGKLVVERLTSKPRVTPGRSPDNG